MRDRTGDALKDLDPEHMAALFRGLGLSATEQPVAWSRGPRWAVLLRGGDAELWVEADDRAEAWQRSWSHARAAGLLG